jgi:hypothetical protein
MIYDWDDITSMAYMTLIELNYKSFPIPPNKISCKEVIISSFQKYARITGKTIGELTCDHEFDDAFLLKEVRPGLNIILYNKDKSESRIKHTLWHEVGHIKCGHKKHGEKEEIEAHFFAGQANAPNVLIKTLAKRGYTITTHFLMECFALSEESAQKKMSYLNRFGFDHKNEYDDFITQQFSDYINMKYPVKTKHFFDDYFDEREEERKKWY